MLKIKLISSLLTAALLISGLSYSQSNYYVSTDGNDSNSGLSEATAWRTISYAGSFESPVSAGDHVHIKAGNYGNENVDVYKTGAESQPIVFEGYQSIPQDNPNLNYTYGDNLDATIMPLLDGGNRASGDGIHLSGASYFHLKNIQVTNYESGVYNWDEASTHLLLENIIVMSIGDPNAYYSGLGIGMVYGSENTLRNCIVINSCAEGINVVGNNITLDNCKVYCDEDFTEESSMDYYIVLAGDNNLVKDCYIERIGDLEHGGAGMGIKEYGQNNLFDNCIAKNLENGGFYVRWSGVTNNEFRNCTAIGTLEDVNGFLIRDGASYNEFNSCISDGCSSGIRFALSGEDQNYCGEYNTFNNCIVKNATWAIDLSLWEISGPVEHNTFSNCIFTNLEYIYNCKRINNNNKLTNCIITNTENPFVGAHVLNFDHEYSNFYNNDFDLPGSSLGVFSGDPLFIDAENGDYHLQEGSPCIDSGSANDAPLYDFEGTARPQGLGFDVGAYEYSTDISIYYISESENLIYPNPSEGTINFLDKFDNKKYHLVSSHGTTVKSGYIINSQIDVRALPNGLYFITIDESKTNVKTFKIVLKN